MVKDSVYACVFSVIQSDLFEVCGAAVTAPSALQKYTAGAVISWTLEISDWRHPGAAYWPQRCKPMFCCDVFMISVYLSFPLIHRFSYSSSFVLSRQLFQTCTSDTQRPWRHSSHLSSRDSIILTRVKFCRYFKRFTINIVQIKSTKDTRKTLCVLFYRAARWRERKWNCSPCFWHLSRAYTATWVTFRWVSSQSKSNFEDLQILSVY